MAFKEVFNILENAGQLAINLSEQIKNPAKDFSYGQDVTTNKPQR